MLLGFEVLIGILLINLFGRALVVNARITEEEHRKQNQK